MNIASRERVVVLGMMGRMRVAGVVWQVLQYLAGLDRLGYEVYYVEAHGCTLPAFGQNERAVADFLHAMMRSIDLGDRWGFHARNASGSWYGMSEQKVRKLYSQAAAILNLHGGTRPTPEQSATGRLVYIDTDPVNVQVELHDGNPFTIDFLNQHCAFFTFGERYGESDCGLPVSDRFHFKPTRQPVVMEFWAESGSPGRRFTTIGNWRQPQRVIEYNGEVYQWSKHSEFMKFLDLPSRTQQDFELALSSCDESAGALLRENGWHVRDAGNLSFDLDTYREYIAASRAEFTVAKDQNIRLRTGWFSDRSATYLAAGRPVITQETGFTQILPTGKGLFSFTQMEAAVASVEAVNAAYERQSSAARRIAREYFSHEVVLEPLLSEIGVGRRKPRARHPAINIVGPFNSSSGVGTAARRYARALASIGIRPNLIDLEEPERPLPNGDINLVCCDVAACFAARARLGDDFFRGSYNIGLWAWELPTFPEELHDRFAYYDEIWAPSSFVASALSPISPIPVVRIPHVLEPDVPGSREHGRRRLGLSDDEFVFAFLFQSFSGFARKNPLAVIDAFNAAFAPHERARLVIKCSRADFEREHFAEMERRAEGRRITLYAGEWSADAVADFTAACDCYVSLHRAEGVGLTIGDAMAAGKPVIATGWSGNMDFMSVANSVPVRYELRKLDRRVAHYPSGALWAEPSVEHAAQSMRYVFEHRDDAAACGAAARRDILTTHSRQAIAQLLAQRIQLIVKRHRFEAMKQWARVPQPGVDFSDLGSYAPTTHLRHIALKADLERAVRAHVPAGEVLAVVSRGDDDLLTVHEGRTWHFPQADGGKYAGYYPDDSSEVIRHLHSLVENGTHFLLFPNTAFWWLEHYTGLGDYLERHCQLAHSDLSCRIFDLVPVHQARLEAAG